MNDYMRLAYNEAQKGMLKGAGGPFGAVIVRKDEVIAKAHNEVLKKNDATAHAEIQAIRKASKKLERFDLADCEMYTTCYPCPMCYGAIAWAKIKKIHYGTDEKDAARIGFSDKHIYDDIRHKNKKPLMKAQQEAREEMVKLFKEWKEKKDKKIY